MGLKANAVFQIRDDHELVQSGALMWQEAGKTWTCFENRTVFADN